METSQIKGVDDAVRTTKAVLESGATLVINEKILTTGSNKAKTIFDVKLNGKIQVLMLLQDQLLKIHLIKNLIPI